VQIDELIWILSSELGNDGGTSDKTGENPTPLPEQNFLIKKSPQ